MPATEHYFPEYAYPKEFDGAQGTITTRRGWLWLPRSMTHIEKDQALAEYKARCNAEGVPVMWVDQHNSKRKYSSIYLEMPEGRPMTPHEKMKVTTFMTSMDMMPMTPEEEEYSPPVFYPIYASEDNMRAEAHGIPDVDSFDPTNKDVPQGSAQAAWDMLLRPTEEVLRRPLSYKQVQSFGFHELPSAEEENAWRQRLPDKT